MDPLEKARALLGTSEPFQKQNTEDLAFNMLNKKEEPVGSGLARLTGYGSADETEDEIVNNADRNSSDEQFTDWSKLACLLCKRQFPSKEKLIK